MGDWWQISTKDKQAILLLEVVGLLHDLGKLTDRLVKAEAKDTGRIYKEKFDYRASVNPARVFSPLLLAAEEFIDELADKDAPYQDLENEQEEALINAVFEWQEHTYTLAELLLTHKHRGLERENCRKYSKSMHISDLFRHIHGISHYEKETPPKENKQLYRCTYRASPFGYEEKVAVETNSELTATLRRLLPSKGHLDEKSLSDCLRRAGLTTILKALPLERLSEVLTNKRQWWLRQMQILMECGLGDTRRPTNEVTLWDWGYTVASFVKAALPFILYEGWPENLDALRWRVLRINLDLLGLYGKAHRITDLLGIRAAVDEAFSRVKTLLEETYPIANELYHDTTGIYFIFPDFDLPDELKGQILQCFEPDLRPIVELSDEAVCAADLDPRRRKWTESAKLIARPRAHALEALKQPIRADNLYLWEVEWKGVEAEICTACGLRPIGYGVEQVYLPAKVDYHRMAAEDRRVCGICLHRREGRAEQWVRKHMGETIWTDEAADSNGRFALIVGKFDLDGWLDGTLVQTVAVNGKKQPTKSPSPARLRRVWETTKALWEAIPYLYDGYGRSVIPPTGPRLEIRGTFIPDDPASGLGAHHAYELNLGITTLSVLWKPPNQESDGRFISTDNLVYVAKRQGWKEPARREDERGDCYERRLALEAARWLAKQLNDEPSVVVEEPVGYGGRSKRIGLMTQMKAFELEGEYVPIISILAEPFLFMAIVPASRALAMVRAIKSKYESEMGKVRDRLPLHLGLVFAPRRTPLRSVLEAGQAMLTVTQGSWTERGEMWEVLSVQHQKKRLEEGREVIEYVYLTLAPSGRMTEPKAGQTPDNIVWSVRTVMGDGKTKDAWYPHMLVEKPVEGREPRTKFVADLQTGDKVWVRPSRFDFEFLDATARRFDVSYDQRGRRRKRPTRPYLLEDLERLERIWSLIQLLETTQINAIGGTIETIRQEWEVGWADEAEQDEVFRRFVEDTLAGAHWPREMRWCDIARRERDMLITAAVRGELADVLELHMAILKERPIGKGKEVVR